MLMNTPTHASLRVLFGSGIAVCLLLSLAPSLYADEWEAQYVPATDGMPDQAVNPWKVVVQNEGATASVKEDYLRINTATAGDCRFQFEQTAVWNAEPGSGVEVVVRVVEPNDTEKPSATLVVSGPGGWQGLAMGVDHISLSGGKRHPLDLNQFTKLRMEIVTNSNGLPAVEVYINDSMTPDLEAPLLPASGNSKPSLSFGDVSATPEVGGIVDWKSVRWREGK